MPDHPSLPPSTTATGGWRLSHDWVFTRRVVIVAAIALLCLGAIKLAPVMVLVFASLLIGILLKSFSGFIMRMFRVPEAWGLTVATVLSVALFIGFMSLLGIQVVAQIRGVLQMLPNAAAALGDRLGMPIKPEELRDMWSVDTISGLVFGRAANYGVMALSTAANTFIVFVGAVFFASQPSLYRDGALLLVPEPYRDRLDASFAATAVALRKWFGGQLIVMAAVAALSAIAYWAIGVPSWLALAVIAGITNFIPILGPFIGGGIAVLMASTVDGTTLLWTLGAAVVIQEIESAFLVPRVQSYAVNIPPVIVIFSIMVFSTLFGLLGLVLAVPLAITAMIFVQKLWVRATLGEDVSVTGSNERKADVDCTPF